MEQFNIPDSLKEKIENAETLEEVAKLCSEAGYEVTMEDLKAVEAADNSELSEDDLDNVAGGLVILNPATIAVGVVAVGAYAIWSYARRRRR